jgi:SAM-dependent methyltransferase
MRNSRLGTTKRSNWMGRGLMSVVVTVVAFCGFHGIVGAEERRPQGTDGVKKTNVSRYDETARGVNAPMYEYYAQKIKEKTGVTRGTCVDVGSGGGYLGLALARITDLDFIFLDISADALEMAKAHIAEDGLQNRGKTLLADVHSIPLPDSSIALVISRGSIPFWKDPATALKEIHRILAPGGQAYVGGGRGTQEVQALIRERASKTGTKPPDGPRREGSGPRDGGPGRQQQDYDAILKSAGIAKYEVNRGDDGMWIRLWKQVQETKGEVK